MSDNYDSNCDLETDLESITTETTDIYFSSSESDDDTDYESEFQICTKYHQTKIFANNYSLL